MAEKIDLKRIREVEGIVRGCCNWNFYNPAQRADLVAMYLRGFEDGKQEDNSATKVQE